MNFTGLHILTFQLVKDDEKKFNRADKNSDGGLDQDEYNAFYHPWDHPEMHEFEIERALAESDNNGDGFIDLKEYLGSGECRNIFLR